MRSTVVFSLALALAAVCQATDYELAVNHGRVIDPESSLDAPRHLGIRDGVIVAISEEPLAAETVVDAAGLVVAPGFIDRNTYTLGPGLFLARARDGVTTTFNLEEGAADVDAAYAALEGRALIHFGFSASWGAARAAVDDLAAAEIVDGIDRRHPRPELVQRALDEAELESLLGRLDGGLAAGAVGVGMGVEYFPGATHREVLAVFDLAARHGRAVQLHMREWDATTDHQDLYEAIAGAAVSGAEIHVSHLNSSGGDYTPIYLDLLERARRAGLRVTTECYPYAAWMTDIRAAFLDDWTDWPDERFARFEWPATGERLTRDTFAAYRAAGGLVIGHLETDAWVDACVADPLTQVASDGGWDEGKTHPRVAGTHARVLGRYVRERAVLTLPQAIAKMTLLPARSLEASAPQMARKGRIQEGMDADLVVFDPATILDRATYREPTLAPDGVLAVVVDGVVVLRDGVPTAGVFPGRAIRAAAAPQ